MNAFYNKTHVTTHLENGYLGGLINPELGYTVDQPPSGLCPVQAEGKIGELCYYIKARGQRWQMWVSPTTGGDPFDADDAADIYYMQGKCGDARWDAGYIPQVEALRLIAAAVRRFKEVAP